ncbi:hypothetical protein AO927_22535 [Pseudomonas aeruginosa]|nr:hypothetical protein AO927_22535 [Pseudomonas aeruginosa]
MVYPFASAEAEHIALKLNTQSGCASWELLLYVFPQSLFRLTVTVAHVALSSRLSLGVFGLLMPCYRQGGGLLMEDAAPERLEAACAYRNASFLFQLDAACGAPVSVRGEGQAGALSLIRCL